MGTLTPVDDHSHAISGVESHNHEGVLASDDHYHDIEVPDHDHDEDKHDHPLGSPPHDHPTHKHRVSAHTHTLQDEGHEHGLNMQFMFDLMKHAHSEGRATRKNRHPNRASLIGGNHV